MRWLLFTLVFCFSLTLFGHQIPTIKLKPDSTVSKNGWTGQHISKTDETVDGELIIFESTVGKQIAFKNTKKVRTRKNQSKDQALKYFTLNHLKRAQRKNIS